MASSSILDALMGNYGDTNDYLSQDPFFVSGIGLAKGPIAEPKNNTEAWLLPALQGLGSGLLMGYGRSNANNTAYKEYKSSPLLAALQRTSYDVPTQKEQGLIDLHDYTQEEAPEGWTPKIGRGDLAAALMGQQIQQERAQKGLEGQLSLQKALAEKGMITSPEGKVIPIPGFSEAQADQAAAEAKAKKIGEIEAQKQVYDTIGDGAILDPDQRAKAMLEIEKDATTKLTSGNEAQKVLELQTRGKNVLESLKVSDPIRAATAIYGFAKILDPEGVVRKEDGSIVADPGGPAGQLASLYNTIMQEGKLTDQTKKSMKEIIPQLVQNQYSTYSTLKDSLTKAATSQGARADRIGFLPPITLLDQQGPAIPEGAVPTGKTAGGKPVYSVNGQLWVPD